LVYTNINYTNMDISILTAYYSNTNTFIPQSYIKHTNSYTQL